MSGTRLSILALHSSNISLATHRISFQSLIMSSLVVWVEVTVKRITYLPLSDAGTAWSLPRWFNLFRSWKTCMKNRQKLFHWERGRSRRSRTSIYLFCQFIIASETKHHHAFFKCGECMRREKLIKLSKMEFLELRSQEMEI